jgi:hypothetical protein
MPNRGSLVVVLLLAAGLTASAVALWHHRQKTRRALDLWGAPGSLLIEHAPEVTLFRLEELQGDAASADKPTVRVANRDFVLTDAHDMEGAAGFSHVRWGLCQDSSYAWDKDCEACDNPHWDYAIRFVDRDRRIIIALDTQCALVTEVGSGRCESISPIAKKVAIVLARQLPAHGPKK